MLIKKKLKVYSFILVFVLLFNVFSPICAFAKDLNNDEGMFELSVPVTAGAYVLVSLDDGTVITQKNKDELVYPASLTKIVTAMVTIENVKDLDKSVIVSRDAVKGVEKKGLQNAGLKAGDTLTYEQLLYLTMVYSACDASRVLAEAVGGNKANFVQMMNDLADECECKKTNFENADGEHNDKHYTTASDMMLITLKALKNKTFVKIATTEKYKYKDHTFLNTNYMLNPKDKFDYYKYAKGIKTGTTAQAGNCVITMAEKNDMKYLAIVMASTTDYIDGGWRKSSFIDAKKLFEWGFNDLKYDKIIDTSKSVASVAVKQGKNCDELALNVKSDITALVPTDSAQSDFKVKPLNMPESLKAPIDKGKTVCKAQVIYKGKIIAETTLVTADNVEQNFFAKTLSYISAVPLLYRIYAAVAFLAVLLIVVGVIIILKVKKKKESQPVKKRVDDDNYD